MISKMADNGVKKKYESATAAFIKAWNTVSAGKVAYPEDAVIQWFSL